MVKKRYVSSRDLCFINNDVQPMRMDKIKRIEWNTRSKESEETNN